MDLYSGRREFLLELLSYEYFIPEKYYQCVKEAIVKNARIHYSAEDLRCLLTMPQSLSATLRLDSINSHVAFQKEFAKWANCLEYDIFNTNPNIRFTLINPDPSTKSPLLHVIDNGSTVTCLPAKSIVHQAIPRNLELPHPNEQIELVPNTRENKAEAATYVSVWSKDNLNSLISDFLDFAEQGKKPFAVDENANSLSSEQLLEEKLSSPHSDWAEMAMRCRYFSKIGDSYIFSEKARGLALPSNMDMVDQINRSLRKLPRRDASSSYPQSSGGQSNLSNIVEKLNRKVQKSMQQMRQKRQPPPPPQPPQ